MDIDPARTLGRAYQKEGKSLTTQTIARRQTEAYGRATDR